MTDTATPETGPVDAPASNDSIAAEILASVGDEAPADAHDEIVQELVKEAESDGSDSPEGEPAAEDDATDPAEAPEEGETEAEDPAEAQPDEQSYTVKVNGEERTVPLSELLNGYSRTEDYKAKTAAVADERRTLEAQKANLEGELKATYANQLEQATSLFAQFDPVLEEARKIDWAALKQQDPAAYVQAQDAVQQRLTAIQQMRQQVEALQGETQQRQQAQAEQERAKRFDEAANKIVEAMPELADEAKFQTFASEAVGYLRNEGFDQGEIAEVLDHRVLTLADKARRWDAHEAAQKSLQQKKIVQKSAVKPLTTDGEGSRASKPRFPANASRQSQQNWLVNQFLSEP